MRENVIVAYRGANYELGQWPYGYGIWNAADQEPLPLEWWDATPEGWSAAWYRFAALEVPGTIAPVSHGTATAAPPMAAASPTAAPAGTYAATAATTTAPGPAGSVEMAPSTPPGPGADTPSSSARPVPYFAPHPDWSAPATVQAAPGQAAPGQTAPLATGAGLTGAGLAGAGLAGAGLAAQTRPAAPTDAAAPLSRSRAGLAAGLLAVGVVLGVVGLFPPYSGSSLASQSANLWPHLIYLAGWVAGAVLIFRGRQLQRTGALIATGVSVVTFGLFIADVGFPIAGEGSAGAGLVLTLISWVACAAGSAVAFGRWPADWPRRPLAPVAGVIAALIVAAIGVAATFAPAWDKFTLPTGTGVPVSATAGNAFSYPGPVIAGDILVMVGLVAAVAVAAMWRPARLGWALIAGAMIPMVAQVVSAIVQLGQTTTAADLLGPNGAAQLGISSSQPASTSLTVAFWLYCMFVVVLLIGCAWLAFGAEESGRTRPLGYGRPPGNAVWPGAPAGYAAPARYTAPAGYPAPAGYAAPGGQPAPAGYPSPAGHPGPAGQAPPAVQNQPPSPDQGGLGGSAATDPSGPAET